MERIDILILDDFKSCATVLKMLIKRLYPNLKIKTVCDLDKFKELIEQYQPKFIFMDVMLEHGINSLDVLKCFIHKVNGEIIVYSGLNKDNLELKDNMQRCGINKFLNKPINLMDVKKMLSQLIVY